jgi:hypothetical protein
LVSSSNVIVVAVTSSSKRPNEASLPPLSAVIVKFVTLIAASKLPEPALPSA